MDRNITLPETGFTFFGPVRPTMLRVYEVRPAVPDEDLEALVRALCESPRCMVLGSGEGPTVRPQYSKNYRELIRLAAKQDVKVPESMAADLKRETRPPARTFEVLR